MSRASNRGDGGPAGVRVAGDRQESQPSQQRANGSGVAPDAVAAVVWQRGPEGGDPTIISWSAGAEGLYGYAEREAVGRPVGMLVPPDRRDEPLDVLARLERGESLQDFRTRRLRKDGVSVPVVISFSPLSDPPGGLTGAFALVLESARGTADEGLRPGLERLRLAQEAVRFGTWEWDVASGKMTWDGVEEVHGPRAGAFEGTFDAYLRDIHPEDRPGVRAAIEQAVADGGDLDVQYRVVWPDGSAHWVAGKGRSIRDGGGRTVRMAGICLDISEQVRSEEVGARLAAIIDSSTDAIISKDLDGVIHGWNPAAEHLFGYTAAEALGRPVTLIFPPERLDESRAILARLKRGERVEHYETERLRKDGTLVPVSVSVSPLRDGRGRVIGASDITRDISERKQAEAALRRGEKLVRDVLNTLPTFVGLTTPEGVLIEANQAALGATGASRESALGRRLEDIAPFAYDEEVRQRIARAIEVAARGETSRFDVEAQVEGGRFVTVDFSIHPLPDDAGNVAYLVPSGLDITERNRVQQALAASEQRYRMLAEAMPALVAMSDAGGNMIFFNRRWLDYTGLDMEDLLASRWEQVQYPRDRARVRRAWEESLASGEPMQQEVRLRRADGVHRWHLTRVVPVRGEAGRIEAWVGVSIDIEDQKRAAAELAAVRDELAMRLLEAEKARAQAEDTGRALAESEERYRAIGESIPFGVWLAGPDGALTYASDSFLELLGMSMEECAGLGWTRRLPPEDRDRTVADWKRCVAEGDFWDYEYRLLGSDGQRYHVLSRGLPLHDVAGRFGGWAGINLDITERKRMQETLRAHDARMRRLLESNLIGVAFADIDGRIAEANDAFLEMVGYEREDLRSVRWQDLTAPEYRDADEAALQALVEQGAPIRLESEFIRKDGARVSVLSGAALVEVDRRQLVRFVLDVTERRRLGEVQRFLAEASSLLAASLDYETTLASVARLAVPHVADWCSVDIVENGEVRPLIVTHTDPDKVKWAREWSRRYPSDPEAPRGVHEVIRTGRPELYPEIGEEMIVAAARDEEHLRMLRHLGFRSAMCVPMIARGRTLGAVTLVLAESGRRYSESDLAFAQNLAHRAGMAIDNARLFREVQEKAEELRKASAAKDEFLGLVSHELRTPITTILGNAQVLRNRAEHLDDDSRALAIADIEQEGDRLQRIVDNMLVLARAERSRKLATEPLLLQRAVQRLAADHRRRSPGRLIEVHDGSDLPPVTAEPTYVEQVLRNLLSNAEKYSPPAEPISVRLAREGDEVAVRVLDRGPGIPPEEREAIFAAFYRSGRTSDHASGAGIGLAVCKLLVEVQGGRVWAQPRPGGGSEIGFALPIDKEVEGWL